MPTTAVARDAFGRRWPEAMLAALAALVFLGFLGSVELWGKREQRASAEAIDTIAHHHWLVAQIQGRPRLEKPPLPRWTIAALMTLTGRRDEWIVRLPSALAALGMVGLVYGLGHRIGGRPVALASGLALTSMGLFVSELRQAGNDGPLAFFTTLALYAAHRRLHGDLLPNEPNSPGPRAWNLLTYAALGLGFLSKGPVALMVFSLTVFPYLACVRRLKQGSCLLLLDPRGLALFAVLALSWPIPVLLTDPNAARIWALEIGQKAGTSGVMHGRHRLPLAAEWPGMTVPWALIATLALALPFRKSADACRPAIGFAWWWTVGNLAMFCAWSVAKPNYFLPCLPGAAILCGAEWVRLTRAARGHLPEAPFARLVLQSHWVLLFAGGLLIPFAAARAYPAALGWALASACVAALGVTASAWLWRRGADAPALAPLVAVMAANVLIAYGAIAPAHNPEHGHRRLAAALDAILPPDARPVMFYRELDEALWFYLPGRQFLPVPGSQPRYNDAYQFADDLKHERFDWNPTRRTAAQQAHLLRWVHDPQRASPYLLLPVDIFDRLAPALAGLAEPIHREPGLRRKEIILLRLKPPTDLASLPDADTEPDATRQR